MGGELIRYSLSAFLTEIVVKILPPSRVVGRQKYVLHHPFVYDSNLLGRIEIPAGITTDFASVPRILWRYLDPEDTCVQYPGLIHDQLYAWGGKLPDGREYTRLQADQVFREAMEISGARWDQRVAAYNAVRLFGASHWNSI